MESLFHTKCHKILDHHKVEVAVEIVECFHTEVGVSVVFGELEELKILMYATNGENDILKDNL